VNVARAMLDAGYLLLVEAQRRSRFRGDILIFAGSDTQKHPVTSLRGRSSERAKTGIKDPRSSKLHIANGFHRNGLSPRKHFMQLKGQVNYLRPLEPVRVVTVELQK